MGWVWWGYVAHVRERRKGYRILLGKPGDHLEDLRIDGVKFYLK